MKSKITLFTAIFIGSVLLISSCKNGGQVAEESIESDNNLIKITKEQFESESMQLGNATMVEFNTSLSCNGIIEPTLDGKAFVSIPISGKIEKIYIEPGSKVKKGEPLFTISSLQFIDLQKEYLETKAKVHFLKSEYDRKKQLFNEQIEAEKEFKRTESEYLGLKAILDAIILQLETLGIPKSQLVSGKISKYLPVLSTIDGSITKINIIKGQTTEPNSELAEIVNSQKLRIKLEVYPDSKHQLMAGQKVLFSLSDKEFEVALTHIINEINADTKTLTCYAELPNNLKLANGSFISAEIFTSTYQALALPIEALIKEGEDYFIFQKIKQEENNYLIERKKVEIGIKNESQAEILNLSELKNVIVKGGYNLN